MFNVAYRRVGAIRFFKLGRLTFSFCVSREFRPFGCGERVRRVRRVRVAQVMAPRPVLRVAEAYSPLTIDEAIADLERELLKFSAA